MGKKEAFKSISKVFPSKAFLEFVTIRLNAVGLKMESPSIHRINIYCVELHDVSSTADAVHTMCWT